MTDLPADISVDLGPEICDDPTYTNTQIGQELVDIDKMTIATSQRGTRLIDFTQFYDLWKDTEPIRPQVVPRTRLLLPW